MLCMVIVLSGSGYLLAETFEEGNAEVMEASVTDVPAEDATVQEETTEAGSDATVEVEIPAQQEEASAPAAETPAAEAPAAETPAAESAEPIRQLTYEDDDVKVIVDATEAGNIPDGATLSVTPLEKKEVTAGMSAEEKAKIEEVNAQYDLTETKLQEKAENEEYDIAGFLAYDITFVDADGNKLEPNGNVKVSMEYKKAVVPEEVEQAEAEAKANNDEYKADVTVMHLEEDSNGTVKEVVDMVADKNEVATVDTTTTSKVKKAEFVTNSFSVFTLTWINDERQAKFTIHYVDENGNDIPGLSTNVSGRIDKKSYYYLEQYKVDIDGYEFQKITRDNINGIELIKLYRNDGSTIYSVSIDGSKTEWFKYEKNQKIEKDIYYVYKSTGSSGGSGGAVSSTLGTPEHNKYIEKISDEDYKLSLDITGKEGEALPIDILLIIDKSGSMKNENRYSNVNNAISSLKDSLKNSGLNINMAAVTFSSEGNSGSTTDSYYNQNDSKEDAWQAQSWTDINNFSFSLSEDDCEGGTNWQAGVRKGEELLAKRVNVESKKYVLFLTDGNPTFRYLEGSKTITQGTGRSDDDNNNYDYAKKEWLNSPNLNSANTIKYVIDATTSGSKTLTDFGGAIGANPKLMGNNKEVLNNSFGKIAKDITKPKYKSVVIEDTLSPYVELLSDPEFMVTIVKADGSTSTLTKDTDYTLEQESVNVKNLDGDTVTSTKITVSLLDGNVLEDGTKYTLSYHVKPTAEAQEIFIENGGYPHTGDEDTDAEGNITSSGQPGFYSNDNAKVHYQENDGPQTSAEYKKPVVQIDTGMIDIPENPNPIDGSITKTMGAVREDGKYPITLEVKTRMEETSEAAKVDAILVIDVSGSMEGDRLASTKKAAQEFVRGFIGNEGTVSEFHRVGLVTFSDTASIKQINGEYFSGDSQEVITAINGLTADGGTNTEDGFQKALDLSKKSENRKYVIFLTDGVPTYRNDGNGTTYDNNWGQCSVKEYNQAVDKANELKEKVDGIYTIGLLNGMTSGSKDMDVARRLLASSNTSHQQTGYTDCYKPTETSGNISGSSQGTVSWDDSTSYTYSDGYFEITSSTNADTQLEAIWKKLATIINNSTAGSTGGGWTVTDQMADYTMFCELDGAEMNGHKLSLSSDKTSLTTTIDERLVTVAEYNRVNETLTWYLNDALAEQSIKYNHGVDYTYRLTYYVDFEDSGKTEFRKTNETTYVTKKEGEGGGKLYPPKMPFFVNVIGDKLKVDSDIGLAGAKFSVYRDSEKQNPIAENITSAENGHFAFQIGQSDMTLTTDENGNESYTMTVYLEETEAPYGYVKDEKLHEITISVPKVTYAAKDSTGAQEGTPSGVVSIDYTQDSDDILSVDETTDGLKLAYSNIPRADWGIIKRSKSNHENYLEGAEFGLYKKNESDQIDRNPSYTGTSNTHGVISKWKDVTNGNAEIEGRNIPAGTYILKETKAPEGYSVSDVKWTIGISKDEITVKLDNKEDLPKLTKAELSKIKINDPSIDVNGAYFYYDNEVLYELPSAGGPGIFWYTIGGILLMIAAALILYKNKCREVLNR